MRSIIFFSFFLLSSVSFFAQQKDTIPYLERDSLYQIHSPRKAILLSAGLPGLGQIYNKKIWKAPIVWAGLGASAYFVIDNTREHKRFKAAYIAVRDDDPLTLNTTEYSDGQLEEVLDFYQKNKEISYIVLGAVYLLNLLDAYVDGYLYHYDINQNLTAGIAPSFSFGQTNQAGISLVINFK